ncbi:MAG: hypothetical protein HC828_21335 [Blastochloris sp.]|nr:hypothetical protein [Blastochloris sp.]
MSSSKYDGEAELRMKAPDNVGLNITTFYNSRGGTLALWAEDMIKKLGERGYVLQRQSAVKSANGREGTRFDFSYEPPGSDDGLKFYTAVLFVTDDWQVVVQLEDFRAGLDQIGEAVRQGTSLLAPREDPASSQVVTPLVEQLATASRAHRPAISPG